MGAIGHPGDIERLRMAAIELASTEGFTRSAADVSLRRLAYYSLSPALKAAFDDAKSKAALLAQAAGRTLGPAISITEGGGMPSPPPRPYGMVMAAKAEAVSEVPVESGTQENAYTVSVVFELR